MLNTLSWPQRIVGLVIVAALVFFAAHLSAAQKVSAESQFLPEDHIVLKSARDVNVNASTVVVPIHRGVAHGKTVWYIITDASDFGIAHDLDVLYAPKLVNMAINCPECVQTATLGRPTGKFNNDAVLHFEDAPDFSPTRVYQPSATGFPPIKAAPGAVGGPRYSPFVRIAGSDVIYNMSIVATGDGPYDVIHHTNTADRVLAIDTRQDADGPEVTMLLAHGFDSGQPIVYLSTEASDPGAAAVERATYVPLLNKAPFANGDDNLGSARERIFVFLNGQTSGENAQGLMYLALRCHLGEDATLDNSAQLCSPLNAQGDFPSLDDPRHANAYSPLWDVQLGAWTPAAAKAGKNTRQTDENQILNLVGEGYLTGPGGAPYGSVFVVNCPPVAYVNQRPSADLASNVFNR
ncbi:MAG TPA: hypothetical protein VMG98_14135 [Verrucomicrobiae bacterium]|nr:hypothetical protein [Verrucomicrobiae bacterium]